MITLSFNDAIDQSYVVGIIYIDTVDSARIQVLKSDWERVSGKFIELGWTLTKAYCA